MIITFVLPGVGISGGVRSTFEIANRLLDRGHTIRILYSRTVSLYQPEGRKARQRVRRLIEQFKGPRCIEGVQWFDIRAEILDVPVVKNKYVPQADIIVATWWANAFDVNDLGPDKGTKWHFIRSYETWGGPEALVDRAYTLPLKKMAVSQKLKSFITNKFGVQVHGPFPNAVNFELFYKEDSRQVESNPKRVGMLYRQQELKGMKDGFEAFVRVRSQYPGIKLVLFGEEPTEDDKAIIEKIGNVEFHLLPCKDELRRIYNSLDVFVFPSHYEGWANPPMEAMACGVACVLTDVGAVREYCIDGQTAFLVPSSNPSRLADTIIYLLQDEKRRKDIARRAQSYIRQFTWDRTVREVEALFKESAGS